MWIGNIILSEVVMKDGLLGPLDKLPLQITGQFLRISSAPWAPRNTLPDLLHVRTARSCGRTSFPPLRGDSGFRDRAIIVGSRQGTALPLQPGSHHVVRGSRAQSFPITWSSLRHPGSQSPNAALSWANLKLCSVLLRNPGQLTSALLLLYVDNQQGECA